MLGNTPDQLRHGRAVLFARPVPEEKLANLVRQLAVLERKVIDMDKPAPSPT